MDVDPKIFGCINYFQCMPMDSIRLVNNIPLVGDMEDLALLGMKLH